MSTNVTVTYSDLSSLKSDVNILKSEVEKGSAIFQNYGGGTTSVVPLSNLSFLLLTIKVTIPKKSTVGKITTASVVNAGSSWIQNLNSQYFVALSDVKSPETDPRTFSSALFTSIREKGALSVANGNTIGEVRASSANNEKDTIVYVDLLVVVLNQ